MAEMMQFIGYTALIDAVVAIVAWVVLYMRNSKMPAGSGGKAQALATYLVATVAFLVLISFTMLKLDPGSQAQNTMVMISDLVLWVSLILFIRLMYSESPSKGSMNTMIGLFCVFALIRTIWQLMLLAGADPVALLGDAIAGPQGMISQFDRWLMYVVWVPSAIALIGVALRADNSLVRVRSLMFAIGLLLITFTWVFRFLPTIARGQTEYMLVGAASIIGFVLLLAGVMYRGSAQSQMAGQTS